LISIKNTARRALPRASQAAEARRGHLTACQLAPRRVYAGAAGFGAPALAAFAACFRSFLACLAAVTKRFLDFCFLCLFLSIWAVVNGGSD